MESYHISDGVILARGLYLPCGKGSRLHCYGYIVCCLALCITESALDWLTGWLLARQLCLYSSGWR
jgi:hypothetical protein